MTLRHYLSCPSLPSPRARFAARAIAALVLAAALAGCDGRAPDLERTGDIHAAIRSSAGTVPRTDGSRAAAFAAKAAIYRKLAARDRQASVTLAALAARPAPLSGPEARGGAPWRSANAPIIASPHATTAAGDVAVMAPTIAEQTRDAAASRAERLAVFAQRAADFHRQLARTQSAGKGGAR